MIRHSKRHINGGAFARRRVTRSVSLLILSVCSVIVLLSVVGCAGIPESVDEDLSSAELFRLAQDAYNERAYDVSLFYYNLIVERFGADRATRVAAEYEIAYIYFRTGDRERAKALFEELLVEYQRSVSNFPRWVYILYSKVYDSTIEEES